MQANVIMRLPGGICYAHGRYTENLCPSWPSCGTDTKHLEYLELAGLSNEEIDIILGAECYCVCHSPYSSSSWCEHCKGNNVVGRYHQRRERLRDDVIQQAKDFFGSIDRSNTKALLDATGELLVHENQAVNG